ncbi:unnamed protein product [Bursaphelenchus xylophilus]|uniref:Carbonic anhydrase n=1 Tax=Bursaphelenchus xylophilus TaxID=6326 RepID=A0A1I7SLM3_BURXY|nr:unnamed protein product [Bursaphelenchus xylophilus]CAG9129670.1 unnamed protein product [Bursaphelenchus xylophilus]
MSRRIKRARLDPPAANLAGGPSLRRRPERRADSAPSAVGGPARKRRVQKKRRDSSSSRSSGSLDSPISRNSMHAWNYDDEGECGPKNWPGQIDGKYQSPIDLKLSKMKVVNLDDHFVFENYDKVLVGEFVNNGHSVQFIPDAGQAIPTVSGGMLDQKYQFVQYHYHWGQHEGGSEHTIGGLRYPAELHLVHQGVDDPTKLAVLGVFLKLGEQENALRAEVDILPNIIECGQKCRLEKGVRLQDKLPECPSSFARYDGSLTTPPCSENVVWTVFTDPVEVTEHQLDLLRNVKDNRGAIIRKNYRPVQSWNDRKVFLAC